MTLLRFLLMAPRQIVVVIALTGVISGLCSAAIVALINYALHASAGNVWILLLGMIVLTLGKIFSGIMSKWLLVKYAQQALLDLSLNLCRSILAAPFRQIEQTGAHRLLTALTTDVPVLGAALQLIPTITVNAAVILGCGAYLLWLYPPGFLAIVGIVLGGAAIYAGLHSSAFRAIFAARERREDLMGSFRSLIEGIKELKMNQSRREEFVTSKLEETAEELKRQNLIATKKYMFVEGWSQALFYIMLAGILLFFPRDLPNSTEILTGFAFAALYVMTPVWALIGAAPTFANGAASLKKLNDFDLPLTDLSKGPSKTSGARYATENHVELSNVTFKYGEGKDDFELGPINLTLQPGELAFLVGGNGSGKTTLVKLLAGLYLPDGGEIRLAGTTITNETLEWYRQHVSAVFFDFHLFDSLLGAVQPDLDAVATQYLKQLEMDHKVMIADGKFSTIDLSQGQRKRLALLCALIEERPICIFDEWAADQDPRYKEIFYSTILPMLKAQGKTVLVVTHDDRFFEMGDRVIKLEDGTVNSGKERLLGTG